MYHSIRSLSLALSSLTLLACGAGGPAGSGQTSGLPLPDGFEAAQNTISEETLQKDVTILGGDEMEGRGPGSEGDRRARLYLADRMEGIGLEPAFPGGSWEQPLTIVGVTTEMPETWQFSGNGSTVDLRLGEDWVGVGGRQEVENDIDDAPVIFVGYGIEAPEEDWDDFKGADLDGAILVMLNDDPDWDENLFAGERKLWYGRWDYKYLSAARHGAAGAIIIHTTPSAGYPWSVVQTGWSGEQFELLAGDEPRLELQAWVTEDAAERLAEMAGLHLPDLIEMAHSRDFHPLDLGIKTSIGFECGIRPTETANVGGILRGSDPALADQFVVFSAHHDHFGIGKPDETGDTIYNGALDNGVAVAQVLSVAQAFAELPTPPRRSLLFLFVAAEEQGLLGSSYFASSGVIPPAKIAADINFELGNVWGKTRDVTVYGQGKTDLDDLLRVAAEAQERVLVGDTDLRAGWYYRSDHFSFARQGVPSIWFKSGTDFIGRPEGWGEKTYADWVKTKYHTPGDEVEPDWVYDGLAQDARLAFALGAAVAQRDEMPQWTPGDEFEEVRKATMEASGD